jgi:hypothetical protein
MRTIVPEHKFGYGMIQLRLWTFLVVQCTGRRLIAKLMLE